MPTASLKKNLQPWLNSEDRPPFERETWENRRQLLPELEIFGWLRFHETLRGALQADRHEDTFEIHYLKRGHLNWWVGDGTYEFRPGSVFIVPPGELHGGDEESLQPCEHLWLRIRLDTGAKPLPGLSAQETVFLREGFGGLDEKTFPVSSEVGAYFEKLLEAHRSPGISSRITARGILHALLATVLRDHAAFAQRSRTQPLKTWRIRKVLELLEEELHTRNPKVAELAQQVGLSESGFRERFKAETGYSPHEYILDRKIHEARRRLTETSDDITRIAIDLGFTSSQYFATVFRRRVGLTPGGYRQRHQTSPPR